MFPTIAIEKGVFLLSLNFNLSTNRSLLDSLISNPVKKIQHVPSERQVQVFVKQLLNALKCMHDRKIAHLDIRPEVILLQDDHLRLADFAQARYNFENKSYFFS